MVKAAAMALNEFQVVTNDEYAVVKLTGKSKFILEEDETVAMKMVKEQEHPVKVTGEKKGKKSRGAAAQYALAKIFRDGKYTQQDISKAVELITLSAEQKNKYASYKLDWLYLAEEDIPKTPL